MVDACPIAETALRAIKKLADEAERNQAGVGSVVGFLAASYEQKTCAPLLQTASATHDSSPRLTPQQGVVLQLLAMGSGYGEIVKETRTTTNTVRSHVRAIYEKLGVSNRAEAVNLGWRLGLLRDVAPH